jgi:hypothetical protein
MCFVRSQQDAISHCGKGCKTDSGWCWHVVSFRNVAAKSPLGINCNDLLIEPSTLLSFVFLFNYFPFTEFREKIQKKDNIANTVSPFCCRPFPIICDDFVVAYVMEHRRCWHDILTKVRRCAVGWFWLVAIT